MDVVNLWLVSSGRAIAKVRPQLVRKWVELMQQSICRKPRLNSGGKIEDGQGGARPRGSTYQSKYDKSD